MSGGGGIEPGVGDSEGGRRRGGKRGGPKSPRIGGGVVGGKDAPSPFPNYAMQSLGLCALVAQLVEHLPGKQKVAGSSPARGHLFASLNELGLSLTNSRSLQGYLEDFFCINMLLILHNKNDI